MVMYVSKFSIQWGREDSHTFKHLYYRSGTVCDARNIII